VSSWQFHLVSSPSWLLNSPMVLAFASTVQLPSAGLEALQTSTLSDAAQTN